MCYGSVMNDGESISGSREICEALGRRHTGDGKESVHPDLELWIGAAGAIGSGPASIAAIHRGFHTYEKSRYRNVAWSLPLELKRRTHFVPILNDPSHAEIVH